MMILRSCCQHNCGKSLGGEQLTSDHDEVSDTFDADNGNRQSQAVEVKANGKTKTLGRTPKRADSKTIFRSYSGASKGLQATPFPRGIVGDYSRGLSMTFNPDNDPEEAKAEIANPWDRVRTALLKKRILNWRRVRKRYSLHVLVYDNRPEPQLRLFAICMERHRICLFDRLEHNMIAKYPLDDLEKMWKGVASLNEQEPGAFSKDHAATFLFEDDEVLAVAFDDSTTCSIVLEMLTEARGIPVSAEEPTFRSLKFEEPEEKKLVRRSSSQGSLGSKGSNKSKGSKGSKGMGGRRGSGGGLKR